ncbi:ATP-dependent exoDNAse (exonuclease V) beta subunit (contains helicase and exonuclease domains) [Granulicella pectinivorans]|uniref:DNA 3'-5' helicase n=1 Tax=Granulicella pectinivorans TaxID=474950 RepID=A0A1I6MIU5_9BACT|nr:UvrD-helicase domain-containing protein [Granulicella pectinivorans]SFS15625.1 ATP-dependent exoDNAse (exonuclease V) beta subunit (contains helicase and exonuclease domains) [Granulicella pectinivorans]
MADLLLFPAGPPDAAARDQALDTRSSFVVEAPAGSGKTGLLIQRYLKLLGDEGVDAPEQVLAITFTRKATGELRERVLEQLEKASLDAPLKGEFERLTRHLAQRVVARGWSLNEHPRRLKIQTIDAVCAEIARALPLLSGSGGQLSPANDATTMYRDAARRTLLQLGGEDIALDEALRTILLHRDGNLAECERLIAGMLGTRDQWGELVPLSGEHLEDEYLEGTVLPRLERTLDLAICRALTQLARTLPAGVLRELTSAAAELGFLEGYNGGVSPIALCAGRHEPPGAMAGDLAHWRALAHLVVTPSTGTWRKSFTKNIVKFETDKKHRERLGELVGLLHDNDTALAAMCQLDKLPPAKYPEEQWVVAKALFRVLSRALVELQLVFADAGECDFAEIALSARTALGRDGAADELTAALGMETRHLLVDEMQDTSTSQYDLLERLTQGWDGRSQTVFLVGDPKQSIYRFRQARVERFIRTMHEERLGELPLTCLRLTANFRSQAILVEQFNRDFSRLFPPASNPAHPEEVPYVEASAIRDASPGRTVQWHTALIEGGDEAPRTARLLERENAQDIRRIAIEWMGRELPPGRTEPWKIAVLVRSRPALVEIVAAFRKDDGEGAVPFRAVEIEELGERQEVLDLLALTRALLHPADRIAWFAVLHAPWCGLGLADLHAIAGHDNPTLRERCVLDLVQEQEEDLPISEDGEACLARVWPILTAAMAQRGRMPLAEWVERTWRTLGGDASLQGETLANALRYLSLLDELEAGGRPVDLATIDQAMTKLYAEPAVHAGAVDLMTIHKAKGLEWDAVFVPALERRGKVDGGRLLDWMEVDSGDADAAHFVLAPIAGRGEDAKELNQWIRGVHATREAAERKRLMYVACTRAREELHLFATAERTAKGELRQPSGSLLKAAWPMAEEHFADIETTAFELPEGLALAAGEEIDKPRMLYRLPLSFNPAERFQAAQRLHDEASVPAGRTSFERPEGSFAARSFGNAVHAFLELAAACVANGASAGELRAELPVWLPRATALLRADGLAPAVVERLAQRVIDALATTLADADGRWLLGADAPLTEAQTEVALTGWQEKWSSIRIDRMFRAGATPHEEGADCLWIVDYKTTTHGSDGIDAFLAEERQKYKPQLEAYGRILGRSVGAIRLGLYYPALGRLDWWTPEQEPTNG